jgi:hypothetical protein
MSKNKDITGKQLDLLGWIVRHVETHGSQPSLREMGARFGVGTTAIRNWLLELEELKLVEWTGRLGRRALRLPGVCFQAIVTGDPATKRSRRRRRAG